MLEVVAAAVAPPILLQQVLEVMEVVVPAVLLVKITERQAE
jgi:hypothetical protein